MREFKGTPGPWHRNIKPVTKYTTVWSGRNKHVAHVVVSGLTPEEVEANIALIAAAPCLLKALSELYGSFDSAIELQPKLLANASAAIAKALGQ